ncbi:MAG: hypothetical protein J6W82_04380 [Bacteroidales bacterium]|nr:hypothetical protein [Bacteroidales bacterium]
MKRLFCLLPILSLLCCNPEVPVTEPEKDQEPEDIALSLKGLAKMFAELPIEASHLREVYDAVGHSSGNGYDEEYTMNCLMSNPGSGVGDPSVGTKAASYDNPLRNLIRDYYGKNPPTKSSVDDLLDRLAESDYQLYWPYSDEWDGETFPIITWDPGFGAESGYGYEVTMGDDGVRIVNTVYVDETVARERPVWVLNSNSDAAFTPLEMFAKTKGHAAESLQSAGDGSCPPTQSSRPRRLMLKSLKMLRNYDSWFGGASEFWVKCGSVDGFHGSTEDDLKSYTPTVTDFIIVVKRRNIGKELPFEAILVSDFSNQLDMLAFLVTEDDGGTRTSWKCDATVKINSKSYGFVLDIPYNEKDDIVWRGQLSARFFEEEDVVIGRFGDIIISFELD